MDLKFTCIDVKDNTIRGIDYAKDTLTVDLRNGGMYSYKKVPYELALALLTTQSAALFYEKNIKNKFKYIEL